MWKICLELKFSRKLSRIEILWKLAHFLLFSIFLENNKKSVFFSTQRHNKAKNNVWIA
jgi:hypothetical protein